MMKIFCGLFFTLALVFSLPTFAEESTKKWGKDSQYSPAQADALLNGHLRPVIDQIKRSLPLDRTLSGFHEQEVKLTNTAVTFSLPQEFSRCLSNSALARVNAKDSASVVRLQCEKRDGLAVFQVVEWTELPPSILKDEKNFLSWRKTLFSNEALVLSPLRFVDEKNKGELVPFMRPYCKLLASGYNVWDGFKGQANCRLSSVIKDSVELIKAEKSEGLGNLFVHEIFITRSHGSVVAFRIWFAAPRTLKGASDLPQISRYYVFLPLVALHSLKPK